MADGRLVMSRSGLHKHTANIRKSQSGDIVLRLVNGGEETESNRTPDTQ